MKIRRIALVFSLTVIVAMAAASALAWPLTPERVPVHWNATGDVDRYGSRAEGLLLLPGIALLLVVLLAAVPRFDSRTQNSAFARPYALTLAATSALFAIVHASLLATILGWIADPARVVLASIGALFVLLGWLMPSLPPNGIMGVRTPWTLTNDHSWRKTHEAARYVFLITGLAWLASVALPLVWSISIGLAALLVGVVWLVALSYWVARAERA